MPADSDHDPATFREYAATMIAAIVVIAYVIVGFLQMGIVLYRGLAITIPGEWNAAMLSLSSTALGFLFGKAPANKRPDTAVPIINAPPDATITVASPAAEPAQ